MAYGPERLDSEVEALENDQHAAPREPHTSIGKRRHTPMGNEGYCKCNFYPYSTDHAINAYEEDYAALTAELEAARADVDAWHHNAHQWADEHALWRKRAETAEQALDAAQAECAQSNRALLAVQGSINTDGPVSRKVIRDIILTALEASTAAPARPRAPDLERAES